MNFGEGQYFSGVEGNVIHPTAVIGPDVILGRNNFIGPYVIITGKTRIGDNNVIYSHAVIGSDPEHRDYWADPQACKGVEIMDNCVIREFTTINAGTREDTTIGDGVIMLRGSHVGHDSFVAYDVTLSCNVLVGGESYLFPGVNMGLGSICHQGSVLGAYAMIGMGGIITKRSFIFPGYIFVGNPVKKLKKNEIGLNKAGITHEKLLQCQSQYSWRYNENNRG